MNKFTATFADGTTITRKSAHAYTCAWRATWTKDDGSARVETGFSKSREKASPYRPAIHYAGPGCSSNERSRAKRLNAEFIERSGYRVEFAEVEVA